MAEYIEKAAFYRKIAELEERARNLYLKSMPNTPECNMYKAQMNELTTMKFMVADFPAADVAPVVHAKWVNVYCEGPSGPWSGVCTHCNRRSDIPHPYSAKYCPNCGAKMDLE